MTAVSTKVPASRNNGSGGMPPGGPVPMPRVVGNRRIRTGGIALATMLLAFGAALSGIALISVAKTSAYLRVQQDVPVGSVVQPSDLTTVQLSGGSGLTLIPAGDIAHVVGRYAAVELRPGTLLSPTELNDKNLLPANDVLVGIVVKSTKMPPHAAPGETVTLVPLSTTPPKAGATVTLFTVTIFDMNPVGADGTVAMHVAVDATDAPSIVLLDNSGGFAIQTVPGN